MKFSEYLYERPNMEILKSEFSILLNQFREAMSFEVHDSVLKHINQLRNNYLTMYSLAFIRYSINSTDSFYEREVEFFDMHHPIYEGFVSDYYKTLLNSKFKHELEMKYGLHLFKIAQISLKTYSPLIIDDLQKENHLVSEYEKIKTQALILFEGQELNLSQILPYTESKDRTIRKRAQQAINTFYIKHQDDFDQIYEELIRVRHTIAQKLGFKNFIELAYLRLGRIDYNATDVSRFRSQVLTYFVPLANSLMNSQARRLGLDDLKYYDEEFKYLSGNAIVKGDDRFLIQCAKSMYHDLSHETDQFIKFMCEDELLHLSTDQGKSRGGFCTYIDNYKAPFVFSNYNHTSSDVEVLTHELGHAFQIYCSKNYEIPEYIWPTSEVSEIHSISMEYFAYPYMHLFFKEDEHKYTYTHLSEVITFIPYCMIVDEFQHYVYENIDITPNERRQKWRELEEKYLPYRDYENDDFLNDGGFYFRQAHLFSSPFYYIDYALAHICALQYLVVSLTNHEAAWHSYLTLCQKGGSESFLSVLKIAGLESPFKDGIMETLIEPIKIYLNFLESSII